MAHQPPSATYNSGPSYENEQQVLGRTNVELISYLRLIRHGSHINDTSDNFSFSGNVFTELLPRNDRGEYMYRSSHRTLGFMTYAVDVAQVP
jgi:hypothetical protein